jgi:calcium binding protein 39
MSFIFKGRAKTPTELCKSTKESLAELEVKGTSEDELGKIKEKISGNLKAMKLMLYGDQEAEPKPENIDKLCVDIIEEDLIPVVLKYMKVFDFEAKKDATSVINFLLRRGDQNSAVTYVQERPLVLEELMNGYDDAEVALNSGLILRECVRHESLCAMVLNGKDFYKFFEFVQKSSFDVASDAFLTLKNILTKHKNLVADFLQAHYDEFFQKYADLIQSKNYVTMRQSLKLLGEILLDRKNFNIMIKYINDPENLKVLMVLLRHKSKNIQFEAFHIFKVFVANPEKPKPILDILVRNKAKLIEFLQNFQKDKEEDEQFADEKNILLATLAKLDDPPAS